MRVHSLFISDTRAEAITVEYHSRFQIPGFQILGLPAPEIQEARERIASSFSSSGFELPKKKILINLAPASVRKSGTGHDLSIALKILSETIELPWPAMALARGELGLDGSVRSAGGIAHLIDLLLREFNEHPLPILLLAPDDHREFERLCQWRRSRGLRVPEPERIGVISNLRELPGVMQESRPTPAPELPPEETPPGSPELLPLPPFQERIVKLGSIGRHHVLVLGPKGVGKSNSFEWFRHLASPPPAPLAWERALYVESRSERPRFDLPVRRIHAQVKPPHLLGSFGPKGFRAGELSLAHGGILFADEFLEWARDSKECLREPLQTQKLLITRVKGTIEAKCDIQLVASGNLCHCGGFPARLKASGIKSKIGCRCSEPEVRSYLQKLSGPILDRIDLIALFGEVPAPPREARRSLGEIKNEIESARNFALERFGRLPGMMDPSDLEKWAPSAGNAEKILSELGSLRSRHKVIRVALSIQTLEHSAVLKEEHLLESRSYRFLETLF